MKICQCYGAVLNYYRCHTEKNNALDLSVFRHNDGLPVQHRLQSRTKKVLNEVLSEPLGLGNPKDQTKSGHHIPVDIPERYNTDLIKNFYLMTQYITFNVNTNPYATIWQSLKWLATEEELKILLICK